MEDSAKKKKMPWDPDNDGDDDSPGSKNDPDKKADQKKAKAGVYVPDDCEDNATTSEDSPTGNVITVREEEDRINIVKSQLADARDISNLRYR